MANDMTIRLNWIKGMYIYTIIGAGGYGLMILLFPNVIKLIFNLPYQADTILGITGSVYFASGLLSILGIRSPLKFLPVLLLQLTYKVVWFIGVAIPLLVSGEISLFALPYAIFFATYIIGDLIAIPFPYLFAKTSAG